MLRGIEETTACGDESLANRLAKVVRLQWGLFLKVAFTNAGTSQRLRHKFQNSLTPHSDFHNAHTQSVTAYTVTPQAFHTTSILHPPITSSSFLLLMS